MWEELSAHSDLSMVPELDAKVYTALGGILRTIGMGKVPAEKMSNIFLKVCVCLLYIYLYLYPANVSCKPEPVSHHFS